MCAQHRRWPIYATKRLTEIIPHLCASGEIYAVVANVVFHCFGSSNRLNERMSVYFKQSFLQTLNYIYSDKSFLEPPLANSEVEYARELVFAPLNRQLVKTVSPAIRPQPLSWLHANIEATLSRFATYNTLSKEYVCVNGLYNAIGAKQFLKTMKLLRLEHKLKDQINAKTINHYFGEMLREGSEMAQIEAVDMALLLMHHRQTDLYKPFVEGTWRPADVLDMVIKAEAKIAFDTFFAAATQRIKAQAYEMMQTTDHATGLLKYPWGYIQMHNLVNVQPARELGETQTSLNDEHETVIMDNTKTGHVRAHVVDTVADVIYCLKVLKRFAQQQMGRGDTLLAVHIEQDSVTIANMQTTFIIDIWVTDAVYQSTLFNLLSWLWANATLVKVGHKIMPAIAKLATNFDRAFVSFANIVDLANKRRKICKTARDEEVVRFKPAGFSKSLSGLLQEYNMPYSHRYKNWNAANRPICDDRVAHLSNIVKGILSVEQQLREDGWMPTEFCDIEPSDTDAVCQQLDEEIQNAQL